MRTISCGPDRRPYVVPPPCPLVLKSKETFSDDFAPFFRPVGWCWRGKCPLTARNLREFVVTFEICEAKGYNVSALPDFVPVDLSMTCAVSLLSHPSQRFREWVQLNLLPRLQRR